MGNISLGSILYTAKSIVSTIGPADVLDVLIVSFVVYQIINMVRQTRAVQLFKGILILLAANFIAVQFQLRTVGYLLSSLLQFGFVALVVVFQPEVRRALEQVGRTNFLSSGIFHKTTQDERQRAQWQTAIVAICDSVERMSEQRCGALIALERRQSLSEYLRTGTPLDSQINPEIIGTIFFEGSPLHDGAVIVREGKIAAAGCLLPLSPNLEISKDMGTRHRAALGLSEETDAVTVVVSEETGIVSLAKNGVLIRRLDRQNLYSMLTSELVPPVPESGSRKKLFGKVK